MTNTHNEGLTGLGVWGRTMAASAAWVLALALPIAADSGRLPLSAAIIPIRTEINDVARDSLKRRIEAARARGATTLIFEMDTPGGLVSSALDMCKLIKDQPKEVRTVAWVHPEAISAGAMISVACQEIVVGPIAKIGDCAPIVMGEGELGKVEREKGETYVRSEFTDSAERNGYDKELLLAMVTLGREVWWLQNAQDGKRIFVGGDRKKELIDNATGEVRLWRLVDSYDDPITGKPVHVTQPIDSDKELLTLTQGQAVAYGLAKGVAGSPSELKSLLQLSAVPEPMDMNGWERFAIWLNSALVRGILFVIVLMGVYIEFQHPGLILPGVVAIVALAIFLGAPYVAGLADIWTIIVLILGVVLLVVELFLLPGFMVFGLAGIVLIALALVFTFVPREPGLPPFSLPQLPGSWAALRTGVLVLASSVIAAAVGLAFLIRYMPRLPVTRNVLSPNPNAAAMALVDPFANTALVGDVGVVTGDLRPGGQARFGADVVEVCSQGEYIEAGQKIQVIRRDGPNIVVRRLPAEA